MSPPVPLTPAPGGPGVAERRRGRAGPRAPELFFSLFWWFLPPSSPPPGSSSLHAQEPSQGRGVCTRVLGWKGRGRGRPAARSQPCAPRPPRSYFSLAGRSRGQSRRGRRWQLPGRGGALDLTERRCFVRGGRPRGLRGLPPGRGRGWMRSVCLFVLGISFGCFGDRRIQEAACSLCGGTFCLNRGFKPPQAGTPLCFVVPEVLVVVLVFTEESCEI